MLSPWLQRRQLLPFPKALYKMPILVRFLLIQSICLHVSMSSSHSQVANDKNHHQPSALEPFSRDTHGTKWTSTTVRDTTTFGYTYPETQTNNRADTISQINKLYGAGFQKSGGLGSTIHRRGDTTTNNNNNNTNEEKNVYAANPATTTTPTSADDDDADAKAHGFEIQGRQRRYSADLISNKHALVDGSYAIYLFVGDFDKENPRGWALEGNLAGTHVAFSRMGEKTNNETNGSGSGDGNDGHSAVVTGGRIPLTNILREKVRRGELESLEEESVERYLRGNLHWRAAKVSFFFFSSFLAINQSTLKDMACLLISVEKKSSSTIHPSLSKTFPIYPLLSAWLKSRRLLTRMNYPRERILKNWLGLRRGGKEVVEIVFFFEKREREGNIM